jgi:hypothetical protein
VNTRRPWETTLREGDPIQVRGREIVPVVKVRSILRRQLTFGTEASSGGGGGLMWLQPESVIVRDVDGNEERIAIVDATGMAILWMLLGALFLPVVYLFVASLAFVWRRSRARQQ